MFSVRYIVQEAVNQRGYHISTYVNSIIESRELCSNIYCPIIFREKCNNRGGDTINVRRFLARELMEGVPTSHPQLAKTFLSPRLMVRMVWLGAREHLANADSVLTSMMLVSGNPQQDTSHSLWHWRPLLPRTLSTFSSSFHLTIVEKDIYIRTNCFPKQVQGCSL